MDSNDMLHLNEIYTKILKKGKTIYDDSMNNTIENAQKLEEYSAYLNQMNDKLIVGINKIK